MSLRLAIRALIAAILAPCWLVVLSHAGNVAAAAPWIRPCAYLTCLLLIPAWLLLIAAGRIEATSPPSYHYLAPAVYRAGTMLFAAGVLPWIASIVGLFAIPEAIYSGQALYSTVAACVSCAVAAIFLPVQWKRAAEAADRTPNVNGVVLKVEDHERLWMMMRDLSRQSHASTPHQLVAVLNPSFDVYFSPVRVAGRQLSGLTLTVSLPLCRLLRVEEFRAILTHCFTTIRDRRADGYRVMADIYRRGEALFDRIQYVSRSSAPGFVLALGLLPLQLALRFLIERIGRKPGLASEDLVRTADEEAVRQEGVPATANALFKTNAFPIHWFVLHEKMKTDLRAGVIATEEGDLPAEEVYANLSALFAEFCVQHPVTLDFLEQHASGSPKNLRSRLYHLGWSSLDHWPSMTLQPDDPATLLIRDFEAMERELSERERRRIAT